MYILSLHTLMSIQTHKTFDHLQNTNEDIHNEIRELSDPEKTFKGQKGSKDIIKIVHVTSV